MTDIFPRRNLPNNAEPWGREHDKRVILLEEGQEALSQSLRGQNRNTASSLQSISRQVNGLSELVKDISGRVSYSTTATTSNSWTTTQTNNQPWGPTRSFTLDESRTVSLTFIVAGTARIAALGGVASGYSSLVPTLFLDGSIVGPVQPGLNVVLPGTSGASAELGAPIQGRALLNLSAGTHTFQGGFQFRQVVITSGSGTGIITASNPQLYVDVLQPA